MTYNVKEMESINVAIFLEIRNAILQTVAYADVFDYPLTSTEIHRYLTGARAHRAHVEQVLQEGSLLSMSDGYYILPGREELAGIRRMREQIAERMWPHAIRYGRLISNLPFVRMVAVTGSLAMNNVDRDPDIDYLIVTAPGRLWMVRAMALVVARVAAARGVRLCPNYLVTEDALVFPDQTLYAAHELAQMVPVFGLEVYERILKLNPWKERFLPNAQGTPHVSHQITIHTRTPAFKSIFEHLLSTPPGAWFEKWEMKRKVRRLSREQSSSPESCFAVDYCKGHNLRHGQQTEHVLIERLEKLRLELPV